MAAVKPKHNQNPDLVCLGPNWLNTRGALTNIGKSKIIYNSLTDRNGLLQILVDLNDI